MVSLESHPIIIRDLYRTLIARLDSIDTDTIEGAFAVWICSGVKDIQARSFSTDFVVTNYQDIARLAFLSELAPQSYHTYFDQLADGLNRIAGRSTTILHGEPAPFRNDVIALLGLGIGAKHVGGNVQSKVLTWMRTFINPADEAWSNWKRLFLILALHLAGDLRVERNLQEISNIEDLKVAFRNKGFDIFGLIDLDLAYQLTAHSTLTTDAELALVSCRTATLDCLSKQLPIISIYKPTVQQVTILLENLPSAFRRWPWEEKAKTSTGTPQKWNIQNEYHVQSIVYFLLAPIFQDIEHEFYFDPIGQLNSRADIGLPSLNLIIEVKFLRAGVSFSKVIEEIAADASLYFKKDSVYSKKYSKMLVFLWDNSMRIQEHHEFKNGVSQLHNVVGCTVVSRPGNMLNV